MQIRSYRVKCYAEYKKSIGLTADYNFYYGNPVNVLVPVDTAVNGVMIIGAYPSAKFATLQGVTDVPLYGNDSPFSSETYFDGSRIRSIPSGKELEDNYLLPLGLLRSQCWITNLVKVFLFKKGHIARYQKLGRNEFQENRSKFSEYAIRGIPWIIEEIRIAKPRVIFTLGVEVTSILFGISKTKAKAYVDGSLRLLTLGKGVSANAICFPHPGIIMKRSANNSWPDRLEKVIVPKALSELQLLGISGSSVENNSD